MIGAFRITGIADVSFNGDLTYGIGTNLIWALAQMSTGIIVACLPHLRPAFEKFLPSRFTRISTRRQMNPRTNTKNQQSHVLPSLLLQRSRLETTCRRLSSQRPSTTDTKYLGLRHSKWWVR
jgi:hypothetical protein